MKNRVLLFIVAMFAAFLIPPAEAAPLVDNGDGTVSDYGTGLTWQQAEAGTKAWESALSYCNNLTLANASDWRLPNVKELESIIDDTRYNPAIDTSYFPGAVPSTYWSSSTYLGSTSTAWFVRFSDGSYRGITVKSSPYNVRCVRTTCTYTLSSETASFDTSGGAGTVNLGAFFQSCPWETFNNLDWVTITAGSSGTGDGTVQFTVSPNDGDESRAGSIAIAGRNFIIAQAGVSPSLLTIATTALASGAVAKTYSRPLSATGGRQPYTWEVISGNLPTGLFLNTATGVISGIPITPGSSDFSVQVTDAAGGIANRTFSIAVLGITTSSLPQGITGQQYSYTFAASGGTPPYTWSTSSALPPGLNLNSATGELSGTPPAGRSSTQFTVRATDAGSGTATAIFSLQLYDELVVATSSLPDGTVGSSYSQTLTATGGDTFSTQRSWSLVSGTLPPGLSLTVATGVISGTPTDTGSFPFTAQVKDTYPSPDLTATTPLSITVNAACSNARISRIPEVGYDSIASAYGAALDGDTIQSIAADFTGDLTFDRDISVTLKGGYDCSYSRNESLTRLMGTLSLTTGTLTIENIQIE